MTDKQIIADGSWIPIEDAIKAGLISEKDIDAPSNRPDWRITLQADHIKRLEEALKAKEQECERLKEARKNSRCAWKSLEGTFCPQAQEQLNAYKMEADEGKEINAELKAELEQEKALKETYFACYKAKHEDIEGKLFKLSKTLTEIKEIAETQRRYIDDIKGFMFDDKIVEWKSAYIDFSTACRRLNQEILQKISECEE